MGQSKRLRYGAAFLATGVGSLIFAPAGAQGATNHCEASALEVSLLGGGVISPAIASAGPACADRQGVIDLAALGVLQASALEAATTGSTAGGNAASRIADLRLGASAVTGTLTASLLTGPGSILGPVESDVDALVAPGGALYTALAPLRTLGLEIVGTDAGELELAAAANLPSALQLMLPDVLQADLIEARAAASCSDLRAVLSGGSTITGLRVAGMSVDTDAATQQILSLDTAQLQLDDLLTIEQILRSVRVQAAPLSLLAVVIGTGERSLYDLLVTPGGLLGGLNGLLGPLGSSIGGLVTTVDGTLAPLLGSLPIALPPGLLRATVTPRAQSGDGDSLTATAVSLNVTALGQPVLSGDLARARATIAGLDCSPPPGDRDPGRPTPEGEGDRNQPDNAEIYGTRAAELALACEGTRVRLIDVRRSGRTTLVRGYAERPLAGQRVGIRLRHGNKLVGRTAIRADGSFAMRVPLPPQKIRGTSRARYYATVEGQRTSSLKFQRRLTVLEARSSGGKVTFSGHLSAPRPKPAKTIRIQERVACGKYRTVARVKPNASGRFTATFAGPKGKSMAVYRAVTQTPTSAPSRKLHPTYTLPRIVLLGR